MVLQSSWGVNSKIRVFLVIIELTQHLLWIWLNSSFKTVVALRYLATEFYKKMVPAGKGKLVSSFSVAIGNICMRLRLSKCATLWSTSILLAQLSHRQPNGMCSPRHLWVWCRWHYCAMTRFIGILWHNSNVWEVLICVRVKSWSACLGHRCCRPFDWSKFWIRLWAAKTWLQCLHCVVHYFIFVTLTNTDKKQIDTVLHILLKGMTIWLSSILLVLFKWTSLRLSNFLYILLKRKSIQTKEHLTWQHPTYFVVINEYPTHECPEDFVETNEYLTCEHPTYFVETN